MTAKIATGEIEDEREELSSVAAQFGSKGGKARCEHDRSGGRRSLDMRKR